MQHWATGFFALLLRCSHERVCLRVSVQPCDFPVNREYYFINIASNAEVARRFAVGSAEGLIWPEGQPAQAKVLPGALAAQSRSGSWRHQA